MARLVYRDQNGQERSVDIGPQRPRVTIGRNLDCIIHTNNASVSREHAVVVFQGGRLLVQDPPLGTPTNGTYVNNQRMRPGEVAGLSIGDELRCGNFSLTVQADEVVAAPPVSSDPYAGYSGWSPSPSSAPMAAPVPIVAPAPMPAPVPTPSPRSAMAPPPAYAPAYGAPPANYPPAGPTASSEELDELRRENMSLKVIEKRQREQLEQLQQLLLDKDRLLADQERRAEHHDNVLEGLNDKIAKLKEQADLQKDQLRQYRDELKDSNDRNEDLEFKLNSLQAAMSSHGSATASAESLIADLKVQINQRDRRIDDLQRELDLAQYAITTERENVERLELTLRQGNSQLDEFERYRRDMQKVVEQHEATLSDLRRALEEREREVIRLNESLRFAERGGGNQDELRYQIEQFRAQLGQRDRDIQLLETQLRDAERNASRALDPRQAAELEELRHTVQDLQAELDARSGGGDDGARRELVRQLNELKREKRDLRLALEEAKAGGGAAASSGGDAESRKRVGELERELEETRRRLRDAQQAAPASRGRGDEDSGMLKRRVKAVYEALNDIISQWRDDMQTLEGFVQDLKRLVGILKRIDLSGLGSSDRSKLEGIMREVDPSTTVEEIETLVSNNQSAAGSLKGSLRELREIVL